MLRPIKANFEISSPLRRTRSVIPWEHMRSLWRYSDGEHNQNLMR